MQPLDTPGLYSFKLRMRRVAGQKGLREQERRKLEEEKIWETKMEEARMKGDRIEKDKTEEGKLEEETRIKVGGGYS